MLNFETVVIDALQDAGYVVFKSEHDIPNTVIQYEAERRGLLDVDKEISDFPIQDIIGHVEGCGFEVIDTEDDYSNVCIRDKLASLYPKMLSGVDVTEDIYQLVLEASNRIV